VNAVKPLEVNKTTKEDILKQSCDFMACFCGCEDFEKDPNGKILGCVKCTHGRQNHDEEFREAARKNEQQSQKRDADFG
tara:strand:+ start:469 stop:705 length:237 start_codon:yes stop_codon:yes gene_type:complete